ncbi:MAG: ATP-binding protein [Treponemataceae bacterium]
MLIPLFFSFITLFATSVIEYGTLTMRRSLSTHIFVRALVYTLGASVYILLNRLGVKQPFVYYLIPVIYLWACDYLFTETLPQKIFLFFTDWCFTTFVSALCNWATAWIDAEQLRLAVRIALYMMSYIVLLPVYFRYGRRYVREMLYLFDKANPVYAAFPFLAFVLFTIFFGPLVRASDFSQFLTMVLFICFILFTFYLMVAHFHTVFSRLQFDNKLMNVERLLVLQKKYYAEIDKGVRVQRERLHDTRHHLVALSTMASAGRTEALIQYLSKLLELYSHSNARRYCENDVANAVLGGYISIAEENKIAVSVELDLPQKMGIDEYELCTLFGNTLENAIEACRRIPADSILFAKRYIKLKSRVEQGRLTVRIENSFLNDSSIEKDNFVSSKTGHGGVGLESVNAVVDLYQGSMSCERQESTFVFSAVLCLRPSPFASVRPIN